MAIQPVDDGSDQGDDPTAITKISKPAAPIAAPASGLTPQTPTPSAQSPLPLSAVQQPAPVSSSDPLAFSGGAPTPAPTGNAGLVWDDIAGSYRDASGAQYTGQDPTASAQTKAWDAFSPVSGLTGAQDNSYWAGQGVPLAPSAVGATKTGVGANGVNTYDPASVAAGQAAAVAGSKSDPTVAGLLQQFGAGTQDTKAIDAYSAANNADSARADAAIAQDNARALLSKGALYTDTKDPNTTYTPEVMAGLTSSGLAGGPDQTPVRSLTPGGANDAGAPSSGVGSSVSLSAIPRTAPGATTGAPGATTPQTTPPASPQTTSTPSASGAAGAGGTGGNAVNLTPTDANNPLTAQTISAGPGLDRFKIAQDEFDNFQRSSDPAYQASLRDATRSGFGAGRGVSGQLRTTLGDFAQNRDTQLDTQRKSLLNNALLGTIDDGYRNLGIAQQQQGFQAGQQQQAFGNSVMQAQLQDALINSAFGRAQGQQQAGYANDPSNIALILSQIFGQQATGAGQAAAGLFNQAGQGTNNQNNAILQYLLNALGGSGGAGNAPADASGGTPGYPGVN